MLPLPLTIPANRERTLHNNKPMSEHTAHAREVKHSQYTLEINVIELLLKMDKVFSCYCQVQVMSTQSTLVSRTPSADWAQLTSATPYEPCSELAMPYISASRRRQARWA
jgi:hypothetical protein